MQNLLVLAFAAAVSGSPVVASTQGVDIPLPPRPDTSYLTMTVNGTAYPLQATYNGTAGQFLLKAAMSPTAVGTPAYFGTQKGEYNETALFLDIYGAPYGAFAPEVGDDYGHAFPFYAEQNHAQLQWLKGKDGGISHRLQAALNSMYACTADAEGVEDYFLSFGTPTSPKLHIPKHCQDTVLTEVSK